ncbi:superoxide dismutase [Cu-Zn] [Elysia marginata]|uniref:Superoxide dismutase [Cu-Zn] n=1 Tax=Elysia marginata TaxID=1093978 RepID=A0AAV4ITW8_9GAST|nr:superoxide dismutase [Cu-Zn] [Elysia marginata]
MLRDDNLKSWREAVCAVEPDPSSSENVRGWVYFFQSGADDPVQIEVFLDGFRPLRPGCKPRKHGIHIHQYGDISKGCNSTGGHFNPKGVSHGGPSAKKR